MSLALRKRLRVVRQLPSLTGVNDNLGAAPLLVPTTSLVAALSITRVNNWAGNCLQVTRSSDSTTKDIGFVNNVVDIATADAFAGGSNLTISKFYDQSGNGNDAVQAVIANQPSFTPLNQWVGNRRPVSLDGLQSSTAKFLTCAPNINRNNHTIYQAVAPRADFGVTSYYDLTDAGFTTSYARISNSAQNISAIYDGQFVIPTKPMTGALGIASFTSANNNSQIMRINSLEIARTRTVTAQAIGLVNIGRIVAGTGNNAINDLFTFLIYATSHSSAQMQAIEASMYTSNAVQTGFTKNLVYGGTSLMLGQGATLNQQPCWQAGFGRGPRGDVGEWQTYIMSVGGQTLATEFANVAVYTALFDAAKTKNVCLIGDITNDLIAPTYGSQAIAQAAADTFYNNTTLPFVAALIAAGFKVVVPTMIARGTYTTVNFKEDARLRYNADVLAGAVANNYLVSDRGSNVNFDAPADTSNPTYYQADATHLTNVGYGIAVGYDKAAILAS